MASPSRLLAGSVFALALCIGAVVGIGGIGSSQGSVSDFVWGTADGPRENVTQFREAAGETGLEYSPTGSYHEATNEVTDAGAYATDYNNDRWTDVLAIGGGRPVLFENAGGEFRRSNALPELDRDVQAALFLDYDNDGWEDLLLLSLHRSPLLLKNQRGTFERTRVGLNRTLSVPTGASTTDYNSDGCLDLFIIQMGNWSRGPPSGFHYTVTPGRDNGHRNLLYRGTCSGFVNATQDAGIEGTHWSLATSFVDFSGDGRPDIHVANDFGRDTLYVNRGNGTFERRKLGQLVNRSGTHLLGPRTNRNAMASEVADVDGDGYLDLFVTNIYSVVSQYTKGPESLESQGNNLFLGTANATFRERSEELAVRDGGWGWAAAATDFDNDGDRDIFHTTMVMNLTHRQGLTPPEVREIHREHPSYRHPVFFEQTDAGFAAPSPVETGLAPTDGRGLVQFDFDRDGDQDVLIANAQRSFRLYENRGSGGNALQVRLQAPAGSDTIPAGTEVYVTAGNQTRLGVRNAKSDFLSQDTRVLHFGVGNHSRVDVRIVWPDGSKQRFRGISTGQRIVVTPSGIAQRAAFTDRRAGNRTSA
jgi:hypothetical protein